MWKLLIAVCLFSITYTNSSPIYFDESSYNPCNTQTGLYFYSDPTDLHKYYQCDAQGNAYLRSCGDLVWDALGTACNWPSAAIGSSSSSLTTTTTTAAPTARTVTTTTASPSRATSTGSLPSISPPPTPSTPSLCKPVNPCGEHGVCVESTATAAGSTPRFACICTDGWFGKLCGREIFELTTPTPKLNDEGQPAVRSNQTIHFPIQTETDSKLILYGLRAPVIIPV